MSAAGGRRGTVPAVCATLALLASPNGAGAVDIRVKLEPGVAIPLAAPQSDVYDVGAGQSVKLLFGLSRYLDVGPSGTVLMLPAAEEDAGAGTVWGLGAGLRLQRPQDADSYAGVSPWVDADVLYVRTGELNRAGLEAAVGLSVPVDERRTFWAGPFVRYLHVFQGERSGYDNADAKILSIGASFEFGPGREVAAEEAQVVTRDVFVDRDIASCPDRDADTIPDDIDRCPDIAGPMDSYGCPKDARLQPGKLEVKEKLYFAWDTATLEKASLPVLDEVAQTMKDNPAYRVEIEGHADSSGAYDYNQDLSEKRAEAVLDYLASRGVAKDRLISKGFSSSVPVDSNQTAVGRENNRRVEFVVHFIIQPGDAK